MRQQKVNSFSIIGSISYKKLKDFTQFILDADLQRGDCVNVIISSYGGDEGCGRAMAGMIKKLQAGGVVVRTIGHGDVHSAAVLVFAAGSSRLLSHTATLMLHESSSGAAELNATGFKKLSKQMQSDEEFWCKLLEQYTGTEAKVWDKLHTEETYLRPDECLKLNLATELI